MRINQLFCQFGKGFKEAMMKKYSLLPYLNINSPAIFFGCYLDKHLGYIYNHKALAVIIWAGSDIKVLADNPIKFDCWVQIFRYRENIRHIAISKYIEDDLKKLDIKYISLPVTPHDFSEIGPYPLGESVYMYNPESPVYNGGIYEKVKEKLPFNIIEASTGQYSRSEIFEIYKKCFIGLRFTEHDGLSNTVCEMGLMGRMMINNGRVPNCLYYADADDVISKVSEVYKYRSVAEVDYLSAYVRRYLDIGEDFLDTDYYV